MKVLRDCIGELKGPARQSEEGFDEYKERRYGENQYIKAYLKGRLVWDSRKEGPASRTELKRRKNR